MGLLANPASVSSDLAHISDILLKRGVRLKAVFGPQHGYRGETQANMIEWQGYTDKRSGIPVYSLYGQNRSPTPEMLDGLDLVIIDLQDVGARCYTYTWTAALMIKACAGNEVAVIIADRPNPIGGKSIEGPLIREGYRSFVGLHPIPLRHGLTMAEALNMINSEWSLDCDLETVPCTGWERGMYFSDTGLPWVMPSPNMAGHSTALVYPGTVMLEGTNISEGRGTVLPFEIIGAPYIEPRDFSCELSRRNPGGAIFRPLHFKPTWDKHAGEVCGGVQIHISNPDLFYPVRTGAWIIHTAATLYPEDFRFLPPPYEYETEKMPIDIISGSARLRRSVEEGTSPEGLFREWAEEEKNFGKRSKPYRIY